MMQTDIAFVVLHYMTAAETEQCIESIREKIDTPDFHIVVVDNASPNHSGLDLQNKYQNVEKITVLRLSSNLGFANGNNAGFQFAKYNLNSRFIVMLNNDTYLTTTDFYAVVCREFADSGFAVLGPKILTPSKSLNVNPVGNSLWSDERLVREIKYKKEVLIRSYLHVDEILPAIKRKIMRLCGISVQQDNAVCDASLSSHRQENVQLHGCCLVFSEIFIRKFDGLDSRTFMFMEEDILFTQMMKLQLPMVYNPDLEIFHLEDVSTDAIYRKPRKKRIFLLKNWLKSARVLRDVLREDGKIFCQRISV